MIDDVPRYPSLRGRLFPLIWTLLYPLRLYIRLFPIQRGKGILLRRIVTPLLPPVEVEFDLLVPGAARVGLRYRERLGLSSLLYGTFELAELTFVSRYLKPGDMAMDIGANVGIFSVVMGATVGALGRVFAFEPVPSNIFRLERNLRRNGLGNVQTLPLALGISDGQMMLHMATDPAYPSLREVQGGLGNGTDVPVQVRSLDGVWEELGRPDITLVKIDVEGAETDVLRGAARFLMTCRPTLLVEANSMEHLDVLCEQLCSLGYRHVRLEGFVPMNHLFIFPASGEKRVPLA